MKYFRYTLVAVLCTLFLAGSVHNPLLVAGKTPTYPSNVHSVWPVASAADVDAKSTGSTTISNTNDWEYHPYLVSLETVDSSGVIVAATVSVGTNSPNFDNIVPLTTLGIPVAINNILVNSIKVPTGTDIKVRVITASTGTTHKFRVALWGHLGFP